jgi:hypothetical protein
MRALPAFLIGVGAALTVDRLDRRRRQMLVDRTRKALRQLRREGTRKMRYAGGHVQGAVSAVHPPGGTEDRATDDATVAQRIRSDALREVGVGTSAIDVRVEDGIAHLRGSVDSPDLVRRLVERVRDVHGVRDVATELEVTRK